MPPPGWPLGGPFWLAWAFVPALPDPRGGEFAESPWPLLFGDEPGPSAWLAELAASGDPADEFPLAA